MSEANGRFNAELVRHTPSGVARVACRLAFAVSADEDVAHERWSVALVVPRVAGALLDHEGAGGELDFLAVVEFEVKFTFETDAVVDAVGGVHAGVVGFEHIEQAGELFGSLSGDRVGVTDGFGFGGVGGEAEEQGTGAASAGEEGEELRFVGLAPTVVPPSSVPHIM